MNKISLLAAVTITFAASVSPALAIEYCLDRNSKLYRFLGEASQAAERSRAPRAKGWARVPAVTAAALMKGIAKNHFHVPKCPTGLERAVRALKNRPVTQADIDRYLAKP